MTRNDQSQAGDNQTQKALVSDLHEIITKFTHCSRPTPKLNRNKAYFYKQISVTNQCEKQNSE